MDIHEKRSLFQTEYDVLFNDIYCYALYRITGKENAEDLVSDVFFTAYEKLNQFDPSLASLRTWVFQIARNKVIDYWRKIKITADLEEAIDFLDKNLDKNTLATELDSKMLLDNIFSRLKPEIKTLFALRFIDGLTYDEISVLSGKTVVSLRKTFSRIQARLRIELEDLEQI